MSCGGDLPEVRELPKVSDVAAAKLEDSTRFARVNLVPVLAGAGAFCDRFPGEECSELANAAVMVDEALNLADKAVADYKAGKAQFQVAADAVKSALEECANFAKMVEQASKNYL